jgi:hypothetical protein
MSPIAPLLVIPDRHKPSDIHTVPVTQVKENPTLTIKEGNVLHP